ncbi:hypothetical protein HDU76_010083 [Blyttiomyces sp. JEL0837]|nr:hypothetical protein HDU76_010083 [Blyttiomyces sp. JEL0837]
MFWLSGDYPVHKLVLSWENFARRFLGELGTPLKDTKSMFFEDERGLLAYLLKHFDTDNLKRQFRLVLDNPVSLLTRCACCKILTVVAAGGGVDAGGTPNDVIVNDHVKLKRCMRGDHKKECRCHDDFRLGDLVMLKGMTPINGSMAFMIRKEPLQDDEVARYTVFHFPKKNMVVAAKNMALKAPN